ncbi:flavin reductase family protein [Streptomyces sp. TRM70350]|uniref:flavin reductase family protein n=1 Tax=Streptomyces sp. TRM70350 TaxID=2856165 RepID=UPI00210FDEF2|nr:flavin reductase family protein [Streptomyces sp. TRM70350]
MPNSAPHPDTPDGDGNETAAAADRAAPRATDLRPFMAAFPSGVTVVTAVDADGLPRGMTCSSMTSVALDPPTLVVCVRTASPTLRALLDQGQFAVNLLHERARATSDLFASGAPDRFDRVGWRLPLGAGGPHLTSSAHAIADCTVVETAAFGDHTAVFAQARRISVRPTAQPLLYGLRRYAEWSAAASGPPPAALPLPPRSVPAEGAARVRS